MTLTKEPSTSSSEHALVERIRQGALQAFQTRGIRAVSTSDLAKELGISKSTLYNQFATKEALVRDVILGILNKVWLEATHAMQSASSTRAGTRAFFQVVAHLNAAYPPGAARDVAQEYPALQAEFRQVRAGYLEQFAKALQGAQKHGELRQDVDLKAFTQMMLFVIESLSSAEFQSRSGQTPQTIPLYVGVMIDGLFVVDEVKS